MAYSAGSHQPSEPINLPTGKRREMLKVVRTQLERARLYTFAASQIDIDEDWLTERIDRADRELQDLTAIVNRLRAYP